MDLVNNEARYLAIVYRELIKRLDVQLETLGLGSGQYQFLFALSIEDGRSQQALADVIGIDKAAATRTLKKLESKGYVVRRGDKQDRRVIRVFLTAKGRGVESELKRIASNALDDLCRPLSQKERQTLHSLLAQLVQGVR